MCTLTKECPVLQTAEQDIIVYKWVYPFKTKKNVVENTCAYYRKYYKDIINYSDLDAFKYSLLGNYYRSSRAFYSFKDKNNITNAVFIIPKGAKYYLCKDISRDGLFIYHSNQIMFKELI